MTNMTPSGVEKHSKCTKPESSKTAKCFSSFLLQMSYLNIAVVYVRNSRIFPQPHRFYTTSKSQKVLTATHSITMASSLGRQKNLLAMT